MIVEVYSWQNLVMYPSRDCTSVRPSVPQGNQFEIYFPASVELKIASVELKIYVVVNW